MDANTKRAISACNAAGVDPQQYAKRWLNRDRSQDDDRATKIVAGMGTKYWLALVRHYGLL